MSAPAWLAAQCGCGCRPAACAPGCPCKECQPGSGINHLARATAKEKLRRARLRDLLLRDSDDLTPAEAEELESLLSWTIHAM